MLEPSTLTHKRYAICVGINTYAPFSELNPLHFAEHDAQAMNETLGTLGFEQNDRVLLLGEQATLAAINEALNEMTDRADENDLVVFYFAGYSVPLYFEKDDTRDVFLATYDFEPQKLEQRRSLRTRDALGMERLQREYFEGQGSRKRLFLFDSCYSGEFAGFRSGGEQAVQQPMQKMLGSSSTGRVALLSCLPEQVAVETAKHGHGYFTYYLLKALQGKAPEALRHDGCLTVNTLLEYLSWQLPETQRLVLSGIEHDSFEIVCYPDLVRPALEHMHAFGTSRISEKGEDVQAMLADHTDLLHDRLESFVGREQEVAELQQRIRDKMPTGGYVIITGQAGQGKSSIMAKLVDAYGREQVPFHFIPFNPGPDHQIGLLRNLMAHLVLKYQLSEMYVSAENRATLRDYFPNVLREVVAKEGQEIIFIDGLDQIEEDMNGMRDLSFLPTNPPSGIVFVLATRPDDTLRPLVLLKPHEQYQLPNLRHEDFDLILQHRGVALEPHLVDWFYQVMDENALYLDLVAKELYDNPGLSPQELMVNIGNNPDNIFTLAITRFKQQPLAWREVIKPILGILLASREPLAAWHIQHILGLDGDRLRDGIMRLGGLLCENEQHCYSLFHLKLQEYLCQDEQRPEKDFVFTNDAVVQWHAMFVTWCEHGSLMHLWEDTQNIGEQGRRKYARYHYIEHLYAAHQYEKIFQMFDDGIHGKEKGRYDCTNRLYMQDLVFGQRAAIDYGKEITNDITALPFLWKYTLLRGSLRVRADHYPESIFYAMLCLHREREVLGLVELIRDHQKRITIVNLLGFHYVEDSRQAEGMQMFLWAISIAQQMKYTSDRARALSSIAEAMAQAQQWEQAAEIAWQAIVVAREIDYAYSREEVMIGMAKVLAQAKRWKQMVVVVREFKGAYDRTIFSCRIAEALVRMQQRDQAVELARQAVAIARGIEDVSARARALSAIAKVFVQAQQWEQAATIAGQVTAVAWEIEDASVSAKVLSEIAEVWVQAQQWEQAALVARQAVGISRKIEDLSDRVYALCRIVEVYVKVQKWEQSAKIMKKAIDIARDIDDEYDYVYALSEIAEVMAQVQQWEPEVGIAGQAIVIIREIKNAPDCAYALRGIAAALARTQQWERAAEVAREIEDASDYVEALSEIAVLMVQAQQWEQAIETVGRAAEIAREIEDPYARAEALSEIAKALACTQQWERAAEVAREIEGAFARAETFRRIAVVMVQAQQWEQAIETAGRAAELAREIEDPYARAEALNGIAEVLVHVQQWEQAVMVMNQAEAAIMRMRNASGHARALNGIAEALVHAQQWEQATETAGRAAEMARKIEDVSARINALCRIAEALVQAQQRKQAITIAEEAAAEAQKIKDPYSYVETLSGIVKVFAQAQQWEQAATIAGQTRAVAWTIENTSNRAEALSKVAKMFVQAQQWKQATRLAKQAADVYRETDDLHNLLRSLHKIAEDMLCEQQSDQVVALAKQAATVARWIEDASDRAYALREIAEMLARAQQWEQAVAVAGEIKSAFDRVYALCGIARVLAQAQQWEQAAAIAGQATVVVGEIERVSNRARALSEIAKVLVRARQWEQATEMVGQATVVVGEIEDASHCARALSGIIEVLVQTQQWEQAAEMVKQATVVVMEIEYVFDRVSALGEIAKVLMQEQQWEQAAVMVEQATAVVREIEDASDRARALSGIVEVLMQAQQWEQATALARQAEAVTWEIESASARVYVLIAIAKAFAQMNDLHALIALIQRAWLTVETREYAFELFPLVHGLIEKKPLLGMSLTETFAQVDTFLHTYL
ncbi:hypothetical protein KDA_30800 [Dictyobacter alpinus]|uniref:NACHT domain-containing protein n=1 Tax=Dictyobacter alpinus TaxID=2014873 RepID=A0A402B8D2_9CHLR|nr:caspase family protein [Dictyobacter alpinus]GCE27596.1 hypothetical protein KDA_30800 [Dictyobacter alpinus]